MKKPMKIVKAQMLCIWNGVWHLRSLYLRFNRNFDLVKRSGVLRKVTYIHLQVFQKQVTNL